MNQASLSDQTPLAIVRKKKGWTQAYVAEMIDVSVDAVRRWESGRRLPYPESIQKLCRLFAMTPQELGLFKDSYHSFSSEGWGPDTVEKQAAWEIYIELVTRVPLAAREEEDWGILRETLSSLYALFQSTRSILQRLGPVRVRSDREQSLSCSYLAVRMLNSALRPLLSRWHPLLKDYEEKRPASTGVMEYERQWEKYTELCQEMVRVRGTLLHYANAFAKIADTTSLVDDAYTE